MCESCEKGFDGTKGNGYQPCGCRPTKPTIVQNPGTDMESGLSAKEFLLLLLCVLVVCDITASYCYR